MDSVHGFGVLVVVRSQHLQVGAVDYARFAYVDHLGALWDKVPRFEDPCGIRLDRDCCSYFMQQR